jgi:hypothetical protein
MILSDPLTQLDDIENIKKYKAAGLIATKTVNKILGNAKVGCKLIDLCTMDYLFLYAYLLMKSLVIICRNQLIY